MRISSGLAKGMEIVAPSGGQTRPTSAKVRAAVLNTMQPFVEGSVILDLFSGTGGVGLEALSRGATAVTFVEQARQSVICLRRNIDEFNRRTQKQGLSLRDVVVHAFDVGQYLSQPAAQQKKFDIVFADPPYADAESWLQTILEKLPKFIQEDSLLFFEADKNIEKSVDAVLAKNRQWRLQRKKNYGETTLLSFCFNVGVA